MTAKLTALAAAASGRRLARQRAGRRAQARRHPAHLSPRDAAQPLDPRGGDLLGQRAGDADLQQSGRLRPAQAAELAWAPSCPSWRRAGPGARTRLALTFKLRQGVKWHDGKPFTAKDVKCTFDLLQGKAQDKFRKNPRKDWFDNVADVTVNGDYEVTLPPQAAAALAAGDARLRLHADLSLPRAGGADAHASDRHRPVQVRRDEAERVDQARRRIPTT